MRVWSRKTVLKPLPVAKSDIQERCREPDADDAFEAALGVDVEAGLSLARSYVDEALEGHAQKVRFGKQFAQISAPHGRVRRRASRRLILVRDQIAIGDDAAQIE